MKSLIVSLLLFSCPLFAQYSNISLLDQLRLEIEEQDASGTFLMAGNTADVSELEEMDKVEFLQRAIVSLAVERYSTFAGDPYLHKDFGHGVLRNLSMATFPLSHLNYNAYSGRVEYRNGDNWIEFRPDYFPRIEFDEGQKGTKTLVYGLLPDYPGHYSVLLFSGDNIRAAIHRKVFTFENKTYDAGPVATRFAPKDFLYVFVDGKWKQTSFKAKALTKDLGFSNEVMGFIKSHKLNPGDVEDLQKILAFADGL
ncbi:hypothetical protein [Neolewinella agarilytica]|uniref:hypothetical protein n=1 Tax=Neolewinella agarilytica TaxID=478744 RepID=UPI0023531AE3|nr:hypothetical protein [Neolewinella agarilytica]